MQKDDARLTIQQLKESKRQSEYSYRQLLETSSDGIFLVCDGNFILVNPAFTRLTLPQTKDDLINRSFFEFIPRRNRKRVQRLMDAVGENDPSSWTPVTFSKPDGTEIELDMALAVVFYQNRRCVQGVVREASGSVPNSHLNMLRKQIDSLSSSNERLEEFASVISHDLQEPLSLISMSIQHLREHCARKLDPEEAEYIDMAVRSATQAQYRVRNLLNTSRQKVVLRDAPLVDLNEVLSKVLQNMSVFIRQAGAVIQTSRLPLLRVFEESITRLFENLISNALKYRKSDVPLKIRIYGEERPEEWCLTVEDNGRGIQPERHASLFSSGERIDPEQKVPGAGIGLILCKNIVHRHNGKIWLESECGKGCRIHFTLPKV